MINPIRWRITCDHPAGCRRREEYEDYFRALDRLRAQGWQFSVKLNGEHSRRGKDYCPAHTRGSDA